MRVKIIAGGLTRLLALLAALVPIAPVAADSLPPATIGYDVYRDGFGFAIGRSEHRIERPEASTYRITTSWETTGLAALFKRVTVYHRSEGQMVSGSLQPISYHTWRSDKKKEARADFDWSAMRVSLITGVEPFVPGTYDPVSVFYQIPLVSRDAPYAVKVANGKRQFDLSIERVGAESFKLADGKSIPVTHWRATEARGDITDLWLAAEYANYPVKIQYTDREGTVYRQVAKTIQVDGNALVQGSR